MSRVEELSDDSEEQSTSESEPPQEEFAIEAARERGEINFVLANKELRILEGLDEQRQYLKDEMRRIFELQNEEKTDTPRFKALTKRREALFTQLAELNVEAINQANAIRARQERPGFERVAYGSRIRDWETDKTYPTDEPLAPLTGLIRRRRNAMLSSVRQRVRARRPVKAYRR